jgi:EpsI family protein
MSSRLLPAILILLAMVAAPTLAEVLRPTIRIADHGPKVDLETMIPNQFGAWHMLPSEPQGIVSADVREKLDIIYSETLGRTYEGPGTARVMLSLAYGRDQSRALQVHKPEVCYAAQGFEIVYSEKTTVPLGSMAVPVMHIVARRDQRIEVITYWIRSGDHVVRGWIEQNKARVLASLSGQIPDGLLVRVSTIADNRDEAFRINALFLADMLAAVTPDERHVLLGNQR